MSRSAVRNNARERLLASARSLFAERGYNGAHTREIALAARVNQVTLFRIFGSKERLFAAVLVERLGEAMPKWQHALSQVSPEGNGWFTALAESLQAEMLDPVFARLLFFSALEKRELLEMCVASHLRAVHGALARNMDHRISAGTMRQMDSGVGAAALLSLLFNHPVLLGVLNQAPSVKSAREIVDIWLHGVVAHGPQSETAVAAAVGPRTVGRSNAE